MDVRALLVLRTGRSRKRSRAIRYLKRRKGVSFWSIKFKKRDLRWIGNFKGFRTYLALIKSIERDSTWGIFVVQLETENGLFWHKVSLEKKPF